MRERQLEAFNRTDCAAMCTVSGMLEAHSVGSDGDITPSHLVEILHEVRVVAVPYPPYTASGLRCVCHVFMQEQ